MIAICGDLHIKISDKYADFQLKRYFKLFEMLTEYKTLILAGDVFDRQPTFLEVGVFFYLVKLAENNGVQLYIVEGNHDYTRKNKYLETLCRITNFKNIYFPKNNEQLNIDNYNVTFVHNSFIRYGGLITQNKDILISHIACDLPQYNKKAEYDFEKLKSFDFVILGDIHDTQHYKDNVYYTTSPYRTYVKTIKTEKDIDNSLFHFILFDGQIRYQVTNLPNIYKSLIPITSKTDDIIEIIEQNETINVVKEVLTKMPEEVNIKHYDFIETIINTIIAITGESPDLYINDLKEAKVIV